MTVLEVTPEVVLKLTAQPSFYAEAPFLGPMRDSALSAHRKLAGRCTNCNRKALMELAKALTRAFISLTVAEVAKTPNGLMRMKAAMCKLLNTQFEEVRLTYTPPNSTQPAELKF